MEAVSEEAGSAQRNTEPWSSLAAPVESGEELETPPGEMVLSEIEKQIIPVSKDGNSAEAGGQDLLTATDVIKRGEQSRHDERSHSICSISAKVVGWGDSEEFLTGTGTYCWKRREAVVGCGGEATGRTGQMLCAVGGTQSNGKETGRANAHRTKWNRSLGL